MSNMYLYSIYVPTMPEAEYKIITKTFELSIGVLKIKSNFEIVNIFGPDHKQLFTTKFYLRNIVKKVFPFPQWNLILKNKSVSNNCLYLSFWHNRLVLLFVLLAASCDTAVRRCIRWKVFSTLSHIKLIIFKKGGFI